ncbi:2-amino-4-hydroxy-6-hydroxymethyldihydropteridine diphosphokinase [Corynebacterium guaraldiae]|uniref:2-amino-4-hydroxy-6-hydroxymethyldihydropteridine diphosphokinase n=2 Tax=Corynebacterium TaxID=1716 RepID=A0ABU9UKB4_9CORY|nr:MULTISPECIES: 2-amino-4-hydroxy-6-hydroxymethyldihydropteridine diphosphokinase [Corynebacterium]PKZ25048.1 2-amino-4-hydroxy-6-hydroxymethyldihydropteridine diphosphokinase [Corynebacterium aurimucosum]MCL8494044.1 2-amino-4-hydroxy-6-hydroxymethyldihydropteridine diphosphokinase [Corynebacterium intestinale]MCP1390280.1 2-amino-4-hydroxy-6-hydroxymethyldihydropteridine diphosphokinase [Corynebacterium intestinale]MCZ9298976.1 2-amino-4-hydroxy-6-hydroxymethyldihydropteridine diphosphokinas
MRAVLSIGSNMEDRRALLQTVFDEFAAETVAASPVYATPPWGVTDQDEFLNAVLIVDVDCTPLELLRRGQKLEEAAERVRVRHWGPRTLDVDIVQIDGVTSDDPELTLPHPYAHERAFVLVPWLAADEHAELNGTPVRELIAGLDEDEVAAVKEVG